MDRRALLASAAAFAAVPVAAEQKASALPEPTPERLPRWRGFNLLEKFTLAGNAPYRESDFDLIHGWGFDFVQLPMDYRTWIVDGDPARFNEATLREIDRAVQYGRERGIHVNLNFHRAPGGGEGPA
jgi:endoglucanase